MLKQSGMILFSGHPDKYTNLVLNDRFTEMQCVEFIKNMAWLPIEKQREVFQTV